MEINGLPLHALVVHAAVVFGPVAALAGILYAVVPRWRDRLRWPLVALAAVALVSIWVAYLSGESLEEANPTFYTDPARAELLDTHESRANLLRFSITGFAVLAFVAAWLHTRSGTTRIALGVLVAGTAVLSLVYTVLTGEAGAQMKWAGYQS
ncbi:hypothetical protein FE634_07985 [Nocardioides dongxiaopingii]|uniref:DUF2231 domain-containing protein n=1 Tax=Nocardioides sp. S-1144 TaxID=2582905 RepID=UPI00110DA4A2|nr:DUF2231 domain-containing protein [Nocardioides sp. S-1144]QCW50359.1 hypothetical protein FE634_07985 [Nocardioides sp. S-1144]